MFDQRIRPDVTVLGDGEAATPQSTTTFAKRSAPENTTLPIPRETRRRAPALPMHARMPSEPTMVFAPIVSTMNSRVHLR